jgi:hypothetical protein
MSGGFGFRFGTKSAANFGFSTTGSLKFKHHFGLLRFGTLGEQLILQDSVTQSINLLPWGELISVLEEAGFAAGDNVGVCCWLTSGEAELS